MQRRKKVELSGERKRQREVDDNCSSRQKAMRDAGRKYISPPLCLDFILRPSLEYSSPIVF